MIALNCSSWCPGSIEVSENDKNLNHSFDHSVYLPRGWRRTRGVHIWRQDWYEMSPGTDLYTVWRNKTAWSPTSTSWNTRLTSRSNRGHTRSELETKQVSSELNCVFNMLLNSHLLKQCWPRSTHVASRSLVMPYGYIPVDLGQHWLE